MSRYKILPLPRFFDNTLWAITHIVEKRGDPPMPEEEAFPLAVQELVDMGYLKITPIFDRDGWYYDRIARTCWYEWRGTAWLNNRTLEQFEYELSQHHARILEPVEVSAIHTLIVYGSCPKELLELLWSHEQKQMLRRTYRDARIASRRMLEKIRG